MPLNKALEELLAQVKDEADQKALRERFEKYDFLQGRFEGNLRQEDYDRNMNKLKADREAEQKLIEQYKDETQKWKDWAAVNRPRHEELLKSYAALEEKTRTLEEEKAALVLAQAAAGGEGEGKVDPKVLMQQVDETIAKRGYVPKSELPGLIAAEAAKIVGEREQVFFKQTLPTMYNELATMNTLQFKHRDEFGEYLDPAKFQTFRAEKKIDDPLEAYDRFTFEKREAKKYEQIRKEEREKVEKEYASKFNLPGSGAPPASEFGPLQERAMGKQPALDPNKAGWVEAAEAMRAEGKF